MFFTPVQALKLRSTEKDEVFNFLRQYDQYLELIHDRRLAGENLQHVELIRCLAPGLYEFLKDYILDPPKAKPQDQVIKGQHTSEEIREYLDSLIHISSEKISVDDVLRGLVWDFYESSIHKREWSMSSRLYVKEY